MFPFPYPKFKATIPATGQIANGYKLYSYAAGTTTLLATFVDQSLTTQNTNPIILNAYGEAEIWLSLSAYKFKLTDPNNVEVWTIDNIQRPEATAQEYVDTLRQDLANTADLTKGDELIGVKQPLNGAVAQTQHDKNYDFVSVRDFGATGDGTTNDYNAILAAWNACYPIGKSLYMPSGTYLVSSENNFPFRNTDFPVTSLLDCNNMVIFGDGPTTILKTSTIAGADVLQVAGCKNLHFRNLKLTAEISGDDAGSNGISITGGYDNITFDNIWCENLAYLDKVTYIDGGKALSIQTPVSGQDVDDLPCGTLKATNIFADGCVYGFGMEVDPDVALLNKTSVDVDITVSNSRQAFVFSAGESTGLLTAQYTNGVKVRVTAINCMQDVVIARGWGIDIDCQVITTKTQLELLLSFEGTQWTSGDDIDDVISFICTYAKNSRISLYGNKKGCRHKALIGGANDANSGLSAATDFCDIYLDLTGTSDSNDIMDIASGGGDVLDNTRIYATTSTTITFPDSFYDPASDNTLIIGPTQRIKTLNLTTSIGFTEADGKTINHNIFLQSDVLTIAQSKSSSAGTMIFQAADHMNNPVFAIRNDGTIATAAIANASAVAAANKVIAVYNTAGTFQGYLALSPTFTP